MKDKNSVGNSDSKQKKRGARKSVFLLTLFALLFVLPVIISFVLLFFLSEDSKGVLVSQPLSMLIPAASVIFGGGIALFICGIAYKMRCKALVKCTEELLDGSFQPADHECRDRDELKATAGIEKISQQLAELRDGNAVISEKCSDLQNECDGLRFSLLTAKSGPMLFTRAMEKLNKLAAKGETEKLAELTETMTNIMETTMLDAQTMVPLARELELIRGYIDVNDAVTGEKTNFRMSIMCNIVSYKIIPHIVFPIVESFFEFANRSGVERYEIGVEVTSSSKNMLVIVRDNGAGISQSTLEQMQSEIDSDIVDADSNVISLPNINRRLKLYYGDPYGLKISSSKLGTVVRIYLPAKGNDF